MNVLSVCIFVHHMHAWCSQRSEEVIILLGDGVIDICKPPCEPECMVLFFNHKRVIFWYMSFIPRGEYTPQYMVFMSKQNAQMLHNTIYSTSIFGDRNNFITGKTSWSLTLNVWHFTIF